MIKYHKIGIKNKKEENGGTGVKEKCVFVRKQ